jgi:hypothetical protein
MISKVGDQGTFGDNLDKFNKEGYISLRQRDALTALLEVGHAIAHRGFNPSARDLDNTLDITEGILAAIFIHPESAEELADRVPPRPPRQKH